MAITFIIPGQEQVTSTHGDALPLPGGLTEGVVKTSVQLATRRGAGGEVSVTADPDNDVMAIYIANGPVLILNPLTARDLFLAQQSEASRGGIDPESVRVTAQLEWDGLADPSLQQRGTSRGVVGKVFVALVQIVTGTGKGTVADMTASVAVAKVDAQVDPGLYRLNAKVLNKLKGSMAVKAGEIPLGNKPLLVLLHGTFSNTHGTFGKLWLEHPGNVARLFDGYNGVFALDHPTLGESPIRNALELANILPAGAAVHLLSHSRGGLVGEVLARACGDAALVVDDFARFAAGPEYQRQRDDLQQLITLVRSKKLTVTRFVRVACPARGTLLASNRLDAYLSVLKWSMELTGLPVLPEVVGFLAEVAQRRTDPELIPGLAAQMPHSPLVQWLHTIKAPIPGDLRVIAGDMEGDSVLSWLKTLLSDTYFWSDNDLVVQTSSMYGGSPRSGSASFVLNQGSDVSHFSYFSNASTVEALTNGLLLDDPQEFRAIGPLSWRGESPVGNRGGGDDTPLSDKPAVFILPGILGSNLKAGSRRIWLGPWLINGLDELSYSPGVPDDVEPDGPVDLVYEDLVEYLRNSHQVIEFGYDWRLPLEEEAMRLGDAIKAAMTARQISRQPVRILAHSMGGLLARTVQLKCPDVWTQMMDHPQACLLMLGTPNAGSWAPMQVLSGDDSFGNGLAFAGAPFRAHESRALMARFPGFIQLQANLLDPAYGLGSVETWAALAARDKAWLDSRSVWHRLGLQKEYYAWGVPTADALARAVSLRQALDQQDLSAYRNKMVMVLGSASFTPDGYYTDSKQGFTYRDALGGGDGRVTWRSARLPDVKAWKLECAHGDLPKQKNKFPAFLSLLETLRTVDLPAVSDGTGRGSSETSPESMSYARSRPVRGTRITPPSNVDDVFAIDTGGVASTPVNVAPALDVTVINCNLKFTRAPLIIGHYASAGLTGSERVVDEMVGGLLGDALKMGLYPSVVCSNQIFMNIAANGENPLQLPRPEAAIVVGLGEEGKLSSGQLSQTVCQGVLAWSQRLAERHQGIAVHFEIAAALIGSGGAGMSPGQSAALIAQGVRAANERLQQKNWPTVTHLHLVELYLDRATDAWRAVKVLGASRPNEYRITPTIQTGTGWLRQPLEGGYRSTRYDYISAITQYDENRLPMIVYTLDTKRARAEVRAQSMQSALLRELVSASSNKPSSSTHMGETLFKLLIPLEMDAYLSGTTEIQMELDASTASIPWELLNTRRDGRSFSADDEIPWAIRVKLLRKLRRENFRAQVVDATADAYVLVIGEPTTSSPLYPRLPGARQEARAITALFQANLDPQRLISLIAEETDPCLKVDALAVTTALLAHDWRIVHIAGHGEPPEFEDLPPGSSANVQPKIKDPRGVVLSNGIFLGPREMNSMRVVPQMVFINCCHLGAIPSDQLQKMPHLRYDRARFAATVAEQLIAIGVRCVIVAGWAVEDGPASDFATSFYGELLRGSRFIDAVATARNVAWQAARDGNTWAAYQCYGDPDWVFTQDNEDANQPSPANGPGLEFVASAQALVLALEIAIDDSRYKKIAREKVVDNILGLEARFGHVWMDRGEVAEAFGQAWAETGENDRAITWLERAMEANDGTASLKASEQLGELKARRAWTRVTEAEGDSASLPAALNEARKQTREAINLLTRVCKLQPTLGRTSLCGAAYKRMASIEALAGDASAEQKALDEMERYYAQAEHWASKSDASDAYKPALERIAAQLFGDAAKQALEDLQNVQQQLRPLIQSSPDFENVTGLIVARLYQSVGEGELRITLSSIISEFEDLHLRVPAVLKWRELQSQTAFVLKRYARQASRAEKAAIKKLSEKMTAWAQ